jgi:DNA polymerase-3 subunit epsilon
MTRQIILDTETTGTEPNQGDRIVEIGAVEMIDRKLTGRTFHHYLNPERQMDEEVIGVHGITNEFVADKPLFGAIAKDFLAFIEGAELIIHNAPFDLGFLNMEYQRLNKAHPKFEKTYSILDTLAVARKMHPGQRNSLDALCKRYGIDNSARTLHGALLDSEILADVYLAMTGGQVALFASEGGDPFSLKEIKYEPIQRQGRIPVLVAQPSEAALHEGLMQLIAKKSKGTPLWQTLFPQEESRPEPLPTLATPQVDAREMGGPSAWPENSTEWTEPDELFTAELNSLAIEDTLALESATGEEDLAENRTQGALF